MSFDSTGSFAKTESFFRTVSKMDILGVLNSCGQDGVSALSRATPQDSGLTSRSWDYEIVQSGDGYNLIWTNNNIENGFPVAIMLQYGHGTKGGGYIQGQDYINPAIKPILDSIVDRLWKAVTSA